MRANERAKIDGTTRIATETLGLERHELNALEKVFDKVDENRDGRISLGEFLEFLGVEASPFHRKVFSMFDGDSSGGIDFREFVVALRRAARVEVRDRS